MVLSAGLRRSFLALVLVASLVGFAPVFHAICLNAADSMTNTGAESVHIHETHKMANGELMSSHADTATPANPGSNSGSMPEQPDYLALLLVPTVVALLLLPLLLARHRDMARPENLMRQVNLPIPWLHYRPAAVNLWALGISRT
jgi:hypothetical protein